MFPDSRSGTTRICARPATSDLMPLMRAASRSIALSKASGPSSSAPVICLRSAILHSAAASMVDGIFDVTVSTADRIATRGIVPKPAWLKRSTAFWMMSHLTSRSGKMLIAASVTNTVGIRRHIHDEDVADAPIGSEPANLRGHGAHDFVGVEAALHQDLALAFVDQFHAAGGGGGLGGRCVDDLIAGDVQAMLGGDVFNPGRGPN